MGLLCIGDAAHAMSPIGGVGINLAIQDAVATANTTAMKLRERRLTDGDLKAVQQRRAWPAHVTQQMQQLIQRRVVAQVLGDEQAPKAAWPLRVLDSEYWLRRFPARIVGIGVRPEHVAPALLAEAQEHVTAM